MSYSKVRKKTKGVELQMVVKGWEISTDQVSTGGYPSLLDVPLGIQRVLLKNLENFPSHIFGGELRINRWCLGFDGRKS